MKQVLSLSKIFQKLQETLYKASIILIPKNYEKASFMKIQKSIQQNISKLNPLIYENDNTSCPREVHLENARLIQHLKTNQCNSSY